MALTLQNPPGAFGGKEALKMALESFRQSLTDGERQRLVEMQVSDPAKPDENKVMMLIAEIDCQNSRKFSRYVAPKLQPFLDVIQQFSSAVDTFMTSGPPVAQVVWGSVKITLLIVSNFGEYFEKLATLFDSIGKACPRIREFGTLYESSTSLQDLVCRYFAGVIEICGKVLKVSRRPGIMQFSIAAFKPFEREFGESRDNLKQITELIKEEVSLASNRVQVQEAKLDDLERKENAGFRSIMAKWNSRTARDLEEILQLQVQAEKRRVERNRKTVRDNLCLLDPTKAWKQARKQCLVGTATWFEESEEFRQWFGQKDPATIWYPGKMGSGKSILTSNVITYLMRFSSSSDRVSYFFCQDEVPETLLSRNITGSIARQILDSFIESATGNELQRLVTESSDLDTEEKASFILSHYHLPSTCFIVVDGLDQCEMTEVNRVLATLGHLVDRAPHQSCLKLFISSRPEISRQFDTTLNPKFRLTPTPEALREDISTYIEATLYNKLASGQLQLNDITHIQAIQNALLIGAQGMFLWAYLLIEDLCLRNNDQEILNALRVVPTRLSDIFDRLLENSLLDELNSENSIQILKWTVGALRALTIEELREALTVRPGQTYFSSALLLNDLSTPVLNLRGLVYLDEDDLTVHLVHHSFKQHLLSESKNERVAEFHFEQSSLDSELAMLCMTYINFSDFKYHLAKAQPGSSASLSPIKLASKAVGRSTETMEKLQMAKLLLRGSRRGVGKENSAQTMDMVMKQLEEISIRAARSGSQSVGEQRALNFIEYARSYWIYHAKTLHSDTTPKAWAIFSRLVDPGDLGDPSENELAQTPWTATEWSTRSRKISQWICDHDHLALLTYIESQSGNAFPESEMRYLITGSAKKGSLHLLDVLISSCKNLPNSLTKALQTAAGGGHLHVVERLLAAKADVNAAAAYNDGRTALQAAAEGGHLDVVERLLAAKADVNAAAAEYGRTALQAAAGGGHLDVVERLLAAKADVNADAAAMGGRTALQAAAGGGHLDVVERLLAAKADVNAAAAYIGRTALQAAAGGGHLDVVERLLAAKANVNDAAAAYSSRTALQAAAGGGHLHVVERLLVAKADVNTAATTYNGQTALRAAAGGGHLDVVERLLAAKADVNAATDYGRTALQAAAEGGHLHVVERLLVAKADVNAAAARGVGTALQAAAGGGHLHVVERLLVAKADVNAAADYSGRTALQAAAGGGHLHVVERLLVAKADVNTAATAYNGRTALQAAAGGGHLDVVERLLAAKADVNAAAATDYGRTALQAAAEGGHLDVVERLLAAKADVNAAAAVAYNGQTALQAAAGGGHLDVVERLLAAKADVNAAAATDYGQTALQAAAEGGHLDVVERLLAAKADVNAAAAAAYNGQTALQAAAEGGYLHVVERLKRAGAKI